MDNCFSGAVVQLRSRNLPHVFEEYNTGITIKKYNTT
jgi:hypothetical protein